MVDLGMTEAGNEAKLPERTRRSLAAAAVLLLAIFVVVAFYLTSSVRSSMEDRSRIYGETVASTVEQIIAKSDMTAAVIENLYVEYGDDVKPHFEAAAARLMKEHGEISSIYIAPDAVLGYAYPTEVAASTIGFEMLKDPDQGPSAQKAIDDRKTTVAGPHALVEGGTGFICRRPYFDERGAFRFFVVIVYDWDKIVQRINRDLPRHDSSYVFAAWKDDQHVVTDGDGFIFRSSQEPIDRTVSVEVLVPNDKWHLAAQPAGGWNIMGQSLPVLLVVLALEIILFLAMFAWSKAGQRRVMAEREAAANRAKSTFLFNMSHDIRTPMNAIVGFSRLLRKSLDDPERSRDYLDKIDTSSEYLLELVNNVLELARIESGQVSVTPVPWCMADFEKEVLTVFGESFKAKGIAFTSTARVQHPYNLCDKGKVREIYMNLLSNALKYTPEGGTVALSVDEIPATRDGHVRFRGVLKDTGAGMSEEFLPHLFDEFTRERTASEHLIQGTGLGMSIVKRMVDALGGTISVESTLGVGTTFTMEFEFPILTEQEYLEMTADDRKDGLDADLQGRHVLLAEDNDLNAEIAQELLAELGMTLERAEDGRQALELLEQAPAGRFDAVLMDVQMPNMNGYEAARAIRALADPAKACIPVLAMTANAFDEDRQNALKAGMDGHVAKPISVPELVAALSAVLPADRR
ncbi:MAG: response regulator [Coriobacteriia bacterium]|nr:response regulator [Coriobacteriia bacterium]